MIEEKLFKLVEYKVKLYLIKIMEKITVKEMKERIKKIFSNDFIKIALIYSGKHAIVLNITDFKHTEVGKHNPKLNYYMTLNNVTYWNKENAQVYPITSKYYKYKFIAYLSGYFKYYTFLYLVNCFNIISKREENEIIELY